MSANFVPMGMNKKGFDQGHTICYTLKDQTKKSVDIWSFKGQMSLYYSILQLYITAILRYPTTTALYSMFID